MANIKDMLCIVVVCALLSVTSAKVLNFKVDASKHTDCNDVRAKGFTESGEYLVYMNGSTPIPVHCRFDVDATYTAIMQQKYGRESFYRGYHDYEYGFGSIANGDFWMGLHYIQHLTSIGNNVLTVTMQDWTHAIKTIQYRHFSLGSNFQGYRLSIGGYVSSSILPDDFSHNNGQQFATYDRPDPNNCARNMKGGWWYNYCTYTLPTGRYYQYGPYTPSAGYYDGIFYKDWHNFGYSLKYIKMEISTY